MQVQTRRMRDSLRVSLVGVSGSIIFIFFSLKLLTNENPVSTIVVYQNENAAGRIRKAENAERRTA